MSFLWSMLRGFLMVTLSAFVVIFGSQLMQLGAFSQLPLWHTIGFAFALTLTTYALFYAIAFFVSFLVLRIKKPGIAWFTVMATTAGALNMWLMSVSVPVGYVHTTSFLSAVPYAFAVVMLTWLIAGVFGTLKPGLKFWPEW